MKKIAFAILFIALPLAAFGQIGIEAGFESQFWKESFALSEGGDYSERTFTLSGPYFGIPGEWSLFKNTSVQTGLYYSFQKGEKSGRVIFHPHDIGGDNVNYEKRAIHSLKIPVFLRYTFISVGPVRGFVLAGPKVSMDVSALTSGYSEDHETDDIGISTWNKSNLHEEVPCSRWNIGMSGGIGVIIHDKIRVQAGYGSGLLNRYTGKAGNTIKTSSFHIGAAWLL